MGTNYVPILCVKVWFSFATKALVLGSFETTV